uniref:Ig-like domain-containing protein n=1 Tax=Pundamilia nyererei TaxID=303518 RepID=A0A3B4FGH2_9CICH
YILCFLQVLAAQMKYGDPANVTCVACQKDCSGDASGLEHAVGKVTQNGTTMLWTVDRLIEWGISVMCYHNNDAGDQCCSTLDLSIYQSPESVSISFVNHTEMMFENQQYTLQCSVQNVAPVQSLTVTFYRGNTALGHLQSNSEQKKPVNETFTLNITPRREDNGAQYWCEAKLELGPAGPQPPPVVTSEKLKLTLQRKPTSWSPDFVASLGATSHRISWQSKCLQDVISAFLCNNIFSLFLSTTKPNNITLLYIIYILLHII